MLLGTDVYMCAHQDLVNLTHVCALHHHSEQTLHGFALMSVNGLALSFQTMRQGIL